VTGFVHGLVARAMGAAPSPAAQARRVPQFPLPQPAAGSEPRAERPAAHTRPETVPDRRAEPKPFRLARPVAAPAPTTPRRRTIAAPRSEIRSVVRVEPSPSRAPAVPDERRASPAPPEPDLRAPVAEPVVAVRVSPPKRTAEVPGPARPDAQPAVVPEAAHGEPRTPTVRAAVEARRPADPPLPLPSAPVRAEPRVRVRIGRVEVRRPSPPESITRLERASAPMPAVPRGFVELAAARRYVDRLVG
jgi:hypothetical protein